MLQVRDRTVLEHYEESEAYMPRLRKLVNNDTRIIYASRSLRPPRGDLYGLSILCDFRKARIGAPQPYADIQPMFYKAPEILMQSDWGHPADIWNAACLVSCASLCLGGA
jgi:hypothetical protein